MSIDYIEEQKDVRETLSLSKRELKNGNVAFQFSLSLSVVNEEGESKSFDTKQVDNAVTFYQNYKYWEHISRL